MCGIGGIIKFPKAAPVDLAPLAAMSDALAHRGPDGHGAFIDPRPGRTAALVHRRLAIIDRACGIQPMGNEDALVQVVFNGEIYNHLELRRELQSAGHRFTTDHSDTEVLVHGWEQWGESLPEKLRGMFAFAIWDRRPDGAGSARDTLFLARDRMGQKPLFYASLEDGLVFGSTIPTVLAWPEVPRRAPMEQLWGYLQYGYIQGWGTIWRDINQVRPGHYVRLRGEVLDGGRYWSPLPDENAPPTRMTDAEAAQAVQRELARAVESQLVADVPIACFLSGGIDSSIVALLMQRAAKARGGDAIHTVSVGFAESEFDETRYAAAVAQHIGSTHTRLEVDAGQDVVATLTLLLQRSLGQPFGDSSILPTYHLSRAVRALAPVALAGDGGDELFGGYDRYRAMALLDSWRPLAMIAPRALPFGSMRTRERYRRMISAAREWHVMERYARLTEIINPFDLQMLVRDAQPSAPDFEEAFAAYRFGPMQDQVEYLPNDLLYKVDSASMAEALEVRAPFLDHGIVELANSLPNRMLLRRKTSKYILRQAFSRDLPAGVLSRGKQGFAVPVGEWFRTTLRDSLRDLLLGADSTCAELCRRKVVEIMIGQHEQGARDHTHRLFALLMLELWARQYSPDFE